MTEEFVSEPIPPVAGTFDVTGMTRGEPYLRKHGFQIATEQGPRMTLCFERQARSKRQSRMRWWLYTIDREKPLG
jgi:hypothetical protein